MSRVPSAETVWQYPAMRPSGVRRMLVLLVTLATAATVSVATSKTTALAGTRAVQAPISLKVAAFNIEYGGTLVDFDQVVTAVRASGADVVGVEEAEGHIPRLANALGWPYYSVRTQVISKYPLLDPPHARGLYLFVEPTPGRVVAIENVHLPSSPYSPNRLLRGGTRAEIVGLERRFRLPAIRPFLRAATRLRGLGIPVFLTGDFNAPSFRDYTAAMVGSRPQVRFPIRWPVSVAVEAASFRDSYRVIHPNPVRHPGLTWWAARPHVDGWNPGRNAPQDRIDFVYAAGAKTVASAIEGEPGAPGVDVEVRPWPTDHRMVVSTFSVRPVAPPTLVAVERRLIAAGDPLRVTFHAPGLVGEHVAIIPAGGDPATDALDDRSTGGRVDGRRAFDSTGWAPDAYQAALIDGGGSVLALIPFWVKAPGDGPAVSTGKADYAVGEGIDITWANAPGERWDWIGIYRRGADPMVAWYQLWVYTDASIAGSVVLDRAAYGAWPLPAGKYSVYLLRDDSYRLVARADFTIV